MSDALSATNLPLFETRIPFSRRVPSATLAKRPVVLSAPKSTVAEAYRALSKEVTSKYEQKGLHERALRGSDRRPVARSDRGAGAAGAGTEGTAAGRSAERTSRRPHLLSRPGCSSHRALGGALDWRATGVRSRSAPDRCKCGSGAAHDRPRAVPAAAQPPGQPPVPYGQQLPVPYGPPGPVRGIGMSILLAIVTLGIYTYVWTWKTHAELKRHTGPASAAVSAS